MPLSDIETVRLLIGDTDSTDQTLTDAQVQYFLDLHSDVVNPAAIDAAGAAANILAMRAVSETAGAMSVDLSRRAELYRQRALDLKTGLGEMGPVYVGGVLQSELDSGEEDTSLPARVFRRDLHATASGDDSGS